MRDRLGDQAKPTTIRFEYRTNIINLPQHDVEELDIVHVGRSHLAHQFDGDGDDNGRKRTGKRPVFRATG